MGTLLTWLNDHKSDVFFIATANDVTKLPPEFSRAERFDGVFFFDLPSREQKDRIWEIYRQSFGTPAGDARPDDDEWTGAEIKACCRLAALLAVPLNEAGTYVVPVMDTARERVEALRDWANGRCLDAETGRIYARPRLGANAPAATPLRRRVN